MSFYTEVLFSTNQLILKSFSENGAEKAVFLEEYAVPIINSEPILKDLAKRIPNKIKIVLDPEELIFKNIKTTIKDEKVLLQTIPFESQKYFKINTSEFIFTYHIWKQEPDGLQLTLLGVNRTPLEKYIPLIQAGFFLAIVIKDLLSDEKEPFVRIKKIDSEKESLRVYGHGSLIGWNVYGKSDRKQALLKIREYAKNLELPLSAKVGIKETGIFQNQTVSFSQPLFQNLIQHSLHKRFWRLTAVFASLLVCILLAGTIGNSFAKRQNINRIDGEIKQMQTQYRITNLEMVRKRADVKAIEVSRILYMVNRHFPDNIKVSQFEYDNGMVSMTVQGIDLVEANRVKEALESENAFTLFHIEEGGKNDEKRIIFQVKK